MFNFLKIFLLGFFYLTSSVHLSYSAQEITGEYSVKTSLRICADPNNLPYSSQDNEGYENKIADLFAKKLGNIPVTYSWYPMTSGFVRRTLDAKTCDLIITFPAIHELVQNSNPFYSSSYVMMTLEEKNIDIKSLSDPIIKEKNYKIGIIHATPPTSHVAKNKLFDQAKFYLQAADPRKQKPWKEITDDLVSGKLDIAILEGYGITGEDNLDNLGTETLNFIVSTLNVIDMDNLRNRILLKVLPLKV